jgi:hypothetical protein
MGQFLLRIGIHIDIRYPYPYPGTQADEAVTWTDLTPPAAAMVSRDRVGLERREIRGSPRGSAVLCACESGAVQPRFFLTTTVKRPQWARPALGLFSECNPGAAAVAGERPQQRS